jgi:uncharacterized protein
VPPTLSRVARAIRSVSFPGSGGVTLAGALHEPEAAARAAVLLAHCFTCGKDLHTMTRLARGLAARGFAVLRFDFTGLGDSDGEFGSSTIASGVEDVLGGLDALAADAPGPLGLVGHSMGGAAALLAAVRRPDVGSVAVLAAPSSVSLVRRHLVAVEDDLAREGEAVLELAGRRFPVRSGFLDDLDAHDVRACAEDLDRPLLVLHGTADRVVGIEQGEALWAAARQPKGFLPLPGADHLLSDRAHAERAADALATWFEATLG